VLCITEQILQMWPPGGFGPRIYETKSPTGSFKKKNQAKDGGRRGEERVKVDIL